MPSSPACQSAQSESFVVSVPAGSSRPSVRATADACRRAAANADDGSVKTSDSSTGRASARLRTTVLTLSTGCAAPSEKNENSSRTWTVFPLVDGDLAQDLDVCWHVGLVPLPREPVFDRAGHPAVDLGGQ